VILINKTISFSESIQNDGIVWIKDTYIPLMSACNLVQRVVLFKIETQQEADDCFALQILFTNNDNYQLFVEKYQDDFDTVLLLKFKNSIGVYKTVLTQL